jgi:hypothetical protein
MLLAGVSSMTRLFAFPAKAVQKSRSRLVLGVVSLGLLLPVGVANAQMIMAGKADVSQTGAATYNIPIDVAPGTAGIQPKLSFGYDSRSGDGMMGVGWGLYGLSAVTRCPRTKVQDGAIGTINYDANDRFCLDGKRLNLVKGNYGAASSQYRTEIQDFSWVGAYETAGSGPNYFKVWTKSGLILEFGNTDDSKITAAGQASVRTWALNKVTDKVGNYMTVSYSKSEPNGDYYPLRIDYTGKEGTSPLAPYASVRFGYEYKTVTRYSYVGGSKIRNRSRLKTLSVYDGENIARQYRMTYEDGTATGRSRITSIQQCAGTAATAECLPALTLSWTDKTTTFPAASVWVAAFGAGAFGKNEIQRPHFVRDVTGDGRADIVAFGDTGTMVSNSTGTSFAALTQPTTHYGSDNWEEASGLSPRFLVDINGDGLDDIVGMADTAITAMRAKPGASVSFLARTTWSTDFARSGQGRTWDPEMLPKLEIWGSCGGDRDCVTGYSPDSENNTPRMMADVNGDGMADIVGFGANNVYVALSTGTAFGAKTKWSSAFGLYDTYNQTCTPNEDNPSQPNCVNSPGYRVLADVNGDGMADIVEVGNGGIWVGLSTGTAFGARTNWSPNTTDFLDWHKDVRRSIRIADVNGDGLSDVVVFSTAATMVALSTGKTFLAAATWTTDFGYNDGWHDESAEPRMLVDMNGDGMDDIVGFAETTSVVAYSTGAGFKPQVTLSSQFIANDGWNQSKKPRFLADVNGDGLPDIVGFHDAGTWVSVSPGDFPDLMVQVVSAVGVNYRFTYLPLSQADSAVYVKDVSTYPVVDIQSSRRVVSRMIWSDGVGGTAARTYRYAGAKASVDGRGFLGFREMTVRDLQTMTEVNTGYSQTFPYIGLPLQVEKRYVIGSTSSMNMKVLQRTINSYASSNLATAANNNVAGKTTAVTLTQSVQSNWDIANDDPSQAQNYVPLPGIKSSVTYDDFGNALTTKVETLDPATGLPDGYSKETVSTYYNDAGKWVIGLTTSSEITSLKPKN